MYCTITRLSLCSISHLRLCMGPVGPTRPFRANRESDIVSRRVRARSAVASWAPSNDRVCETMRRKGGGSSVLPLRPRSLCTRGLSRLLRDYPSFFGLSGRSLLCRFFVDEPRSLLRTVANRALAFSRRRSANNSRVDGGKECAHNAYLQR